MTSIIQDVTTSEEEDLGFQKNDKPTNSKEIPAKKGVVKQLNPTEVRWFYKLVKSVTWTPFEGRDSLLIELKWRIANNVSLGDDFPQKEEALTICENPIVVLEGYYELILDEKLSLKPIYWIGEDLEILRGTWFFEGNSRPLESKMADEIEEQHLKMFAGQNIPEGPVYSDKVQKPILHSMKLETCRIDWNSIIDITMQVTSRTWTTYLRIKSNVLKIRRSFEIEAQLIDGPLPVNHLIFVVHGIGQKRQADRIVANTIGMRSISDRILKQSFENVKFRPLFLPVEWRTCLKLDEDVLEAITPSKVQFIRTLLNSTVMDILFYSSPKYRSEVTDGLVLVLNKLYELFMRHNPNFGLFNGKVSIIAHSLGSVISYDVITGWSPLEQYEDYVSQRLKYVVDSPLVAGDAKGHLALLLNTRTALEDSGGLLQLLSLADASASCLSFNVQNLFCIGSPLAVFLSLRGQTGLKIFDKHPPVLYNIFHPMDPIAYRMEPLVHPLYAKYKPLRIHRSDLKDPTPYLEMPMELNKKDPKRKHSVKKTSPVELAAIAVSDGTVDSDDRTSPDVKSDKKLELRPKKQWTLASLVPFVRNDSKLQLLASSNTKNNASFGSGGGSSSGSSESLNETPDVLVRQVSDVDPLTEIPPECRLPYRLDYVLKESKLDYEIVSALTSHAGYWSHADVIMFVLMQIYGGKKSSLE